MEKNIYKVVLKFGDRIVLNNGIEVIYLSYRPDNHTMITCIAEVNAKTIGVKYTAPTQLIQLKNVMKVWRDGKLIFNSFDEQTWIDKMNKLFSTDRGVQSYSNYKQTVVFVFKINSTKHGIAVCRKGDKFDLQKGIAIAYARMMGYEIPKEL